MKKWIFFLSILGVLAIAAFAIYRFYAPKVIANAIASDDGVAFIPSKVQKKVEVVKEKVDKNLEVLPEIMRESDLKYDDLVDMIDKADLNQFFAALDELKLNNWETTDEAFDIGLKHITLEGYELERFRPIFNSYATKGRIKRVMGMAENNQVLTNMSIPVAKETAKRILNSKKDEILRKLEEGSSVNKQ